MTVLHAEGLDCSRDPVEILPPDRDIDIASEASRVRLRFFDVKINRETANYAVFEPGGSKRRLYSSRQVKELFHTFLEKRIDVERHSVPSRIIASTGAANRARLTRRP